MSRQPARDVTDDAIAGVRFPARLGQLGHRLMQALDDQGRPLYEYVIPPMIEIPAGQFLMGSDQHDAHAQRNEFPSHLVHLAGYEIALHPVSICEYLLYLQATGGVDSTTDSRTFRLHNAPSSGAHAPELHLYLDYPVEGLTWYEATAYAHWLAEVTGEPWRLPTEAEWEKAARGLDGRQYPWGSVWDKDKANTYESGLQETTPLGSYPDGWSPYGVEDMAGNVFEWTSSVFDRYPYHEADGDELLQRKRVMRGGAAGVSHIHARVTARNKAWPTQTLSHQGMRLTREKRDTF